MAGNSESRKTIAGIPTWLTAWSSEGAVAIRLDFRSTSFCFLTAHLAAGHSNIEERNQDYRTISQGLHFARGKAIVDHELSIFSPPIFGLFTRSELTVEIMGWIRSNVVWAADTNYRIDLTNEEARPLAEADDYETLFASDQVSSPPGHRREETNLITVIDRCAQLSLAMRTRGVFKGYHEAPILFRPTYK